MSKTEDSRDPCKLKTYFLRVQKKLAFFKTNFYLKKKTEYICVLMRDLIVLSVTFTYIKAIFSSAQGLWWWWGDKNCCLKLSKIIFTNFIIQTLAKPLKLACGTSGVWGIQFDYRCYRTNTRV